MPGAVFAFLTSISFGANMVVIRRGVIQGTAAQAMYITVIGGVPLFVLGALVSGQLSDFLTLKPMAYLYLTSAGIIHFILGRYANYEMVRAIGTNAATPLRSFIPLYAVVMAVIILDESVGLLRGFGIGLLIVSPLVMIQGMGLRLPKRGREKRVEAGIGQPPSGGAQTAAPPFTLNWRAGVFWSMASAVGYGTSPLLIRAALADTDQGVLGALIAYMAAGAVLLVSLALPGKIVSLMAVPRGALPWFGIGTVLVFLAQMFRFVAYTTAGVTVVMPIMQTSNVWVVFFSWFINRRTELFGPRVFVAIFFSTLGAIAVAWPQ
ncbi:MAG: Permease of the drug/metabolite transporter (DMT) superfamily [Chloroflexi bacterium]|jgi:drug/metabolite transporter (DMT)-like permease|nr:MAG: Permease of the drug/metabolite transporter (DMT) superfamily [Chloroflexota bacterium]